MRRLWQDGAYDGKPTYEAIEKGNQHTRIIMPSPKNAVISEKAEGVLLQRNQHIQVIQDQGVMEWQRKMGGYGLRSYSELAYFRYRGPDWMFYFEQNDEFGNAPIRVSLLTEKCQQCSAPYCQNF